MRYSVFRSARDNRPQALEGWESFVASLNLRTVQNKEDAPLYSPAVYPEGMERRKENVLHVSFGVLDIDNASEQKVLESLASLQEANIQVIVHSTFSHPAGLLNGFFKCRVIIPFSRPVEFDEWDQLWNALYILTDEIGDPACKDISRIYYFPSTPPGTENVGFVEPINREGDFLDIDYILANSPKISPQESAFPEPDPQLLAKIESSVRYQLAKTFIEKYPPAIEGQNGDNRTYQAALLGGDFGLERDEFLPLLRQYNERCQPPWDEEGLLAKIERATKYRRLPFGWRLVERTKIDHVSRKDIEKLAERFARQTGNQGVTGRLLRTALAGIDLSTHGLPAFEDIARTLANNYPHGDPYNMAAFFEKTLELTKQGGVRESTMHYLAEKIEHCQQDTQSKNTRDQIDLGKFDALRIQDAFRSAGIDRTTPYRNDEILQFANSAGLESPAEFRRRWIIQKHKTLYFFVGGKYVGPYSPEDARNAIITALAPAQLDFTILSTQGPRPMHLHEMVNAYGTVTRHIVADMTATESYYDEHTQTLVEAPCPIKPIAPVEHPFVAQWLRLLTEDDHAHEKMLDWLACLSRIEEPCCALFLYGEPGTGKSLFAHACSRLWTDDGPTDLTAVFGSFNESLANCPVVFGDESIPEDHRGEPRTDVLRSMIQERVRTYKRKFIADAKLRGCIRMILAANTPDMLLSNRKHLTNDDIKAINERFACVPVTTKKAKLFLNKLQSSDPDAFNALTKGTALIEHAAFLQATRYVTPGGRFLVQGEEESELKLRMMTSTGLRSEICHWICNYLSNPNAAEANGFSATNSRLPVVSNIHGESAFLLTAKIVHSNWATYCDKYNHPAIGSIERSMEGISKGRHIHNGERYHVIDLESILFWSEKNGHASQENMRRSMTRLGISDRGVN